MTSSPERPKAEALPPAIPSMWRLCKLGYQHEPGLMATSFGLVLLAALPDSLIALWLKFLGDGVVGRRPRLVLLAALGLGVSAAATWFLRTVSTRVQRRFRDKVTIALESHIARLQATIATIAHHERPDYLDRLSMLRNQVFVLDHMYMSVFSTAAWILRLGGHDRAARVDPSRAGAARRVRDTHRDHRHRGARPSNGARRNAARRPAGSRGISSRSRRRRRRGKKCASRASGDRLVTDRRAAWERWYAPVSRGAQRVGGMAHARLGGVRRRRTSAPSCSSRSGLRATPGDVLLVLAAGARLSAYVGATVGEIGFLRGVWMDGSRRLAWLEDYAASLDRDDRSARA